MQNTMKLRRSQLSIPVHDAWLDVRQFYAPDVRGLILILQAFANPFVHDPEAPIAHVFQQAGYATLALNLLTESERQNPDLAYNIATLGERAQSIVEWIRYQPGLTSLPMGLFALGTAPAAAIRVAARMPDRVDAVAILAGRPDLAGAAPLRAVKVPVCFFVGEKDSRATILQQVYKLLSGRRGWQETHGGEPEQMSEEMLTESATLAAAWMRTCLSPRVDDQATLFPSLAAALSFSASNLPGTHEE